MTASLAEEGKERGGPRATAGPAWWPRVPGLATCRPVLTSSTCFQRPALGLTYVTQRNCCPCHANGRHFYFPKKSKEAKTPRRTQGLSFCSSLAGLPAATYMEMLAGAQAAINKHPDRSRKAGLPHFFNVEFVTASAQNVCVQGPFFSQASCTTATQRF